MASSEPVEHASVVRNALLERAGRDPFLKIEFVFDSDVVPLDEDRRALNPGHRSDHPFPRRSASLARRLDDFAHKKMLCAVECSASAGRSGLTADRHRRSVMPPWKAEPAKTGRPARLHPGSPDTLLVGEPRDTSGDT